MPDPTQAPTANPIQQSVAAQFRTRPTLRSVTAKMLADNLREKYPPLTQPLDSLRLAQPRSGGGRALVPLLDIALDHLAEGSFPDLSARDGLDCYLSDASGTRLTYTTDQPRDYDLQVIAQLIGELPRIIFVGFQDALAAYWGQSSNAGNSRWRWLAQVLQGRMRRAAVQDVGADSQHLQMLSVLTRYPDRENRARQPEPGNRIHAYTLETRLERAGSDLTVQSSDILLVSGTQVLLCGLAGRIESFASLDAFGLAWGTRMNERFIADKITWRQYEPDGDIFEVQAALILNQHLEDLAALPLPGNSSVAALEQVFTDLTDPARDLVDVPVMSRAVTEDALPDWLKQATPQDRFAYHQCLLEQAVIKRQILGDHDLDPLDTIETYAANHLEHQMCLDRNEHLYGKRSCSEEALAGGYKAADLKLTFHVPVGSLEGGYIEQVHMSLVELALKNLSGAPKGRLELGHTGDRELEDWLTADYILQLVQRVNVGHNYPEYLRQQLQGDNPVAQKRRRLFREQRPVQLKTQALELAIKGEAGLTHSGFRCVSAVLNADRADRWVGSDEIVMRPLALLRKPGADADVVQNMFIIEPLNLDHGPHLLFRPAYPDPLHEYASRADLLAAIATPGALQDSVLTWLKDSVQSIYNDGGFKEPRYLRFGTGSDFDALPQVPTPATLTGADDVSGIEIRNAQNSGKLLDYLFGCDAQQLLDRADNASTSNDESRWARLLEGLQLGFNTLLMAVRGPIAAVGWLLQLVLSLKHDLPALESKDPTARELAWIDLLMNISMLLMHHQSLGEPPARQPTESIDTEPALAKLPFRRPSHDPMPATTTVIERGAVGLPSEPPGSGKTLLDFDRSLAGDNASARLLEKLLGYNVPWPNPVPAPIEIGAYKGLYRIDGQLHASVGSLLFRISIVPGFGEVFIIHPVKIDHPGIPIKTDGSGHWSLDRGLKLLGGGPKRLADLRQKNREQMQELLTRVQASDILTRDELEPPVKQSIEQMTIASQNLTEQRRKLTIVWKLVEAATPAQKAALDSRHQTEIQNYERRSTQYRILLDTLSERATKLLAARKEKFKLGEELTKVAGAGTHIQKMEEVLESSLGDALRLYEYEREWLNGLQVSRTGEPMRQMVHRAIIEAALGDRSNYEEYTAKSLERADTWDRMARSTSSMEDLLDQLGKFSPAGRTKRDQWLNKFSAPQMFFSANLKLYALVPLAHASIDMSQVILSPQERLYADRLQDLDLDQTSLSHIEVRSSNDYPLNEQRDLYESLLEKYRRYETTFQALKGLDSTRVDSAASTRLLERLQYAQALAENELETVVRKQEELEVELPVSKTLRPKAATKRLFKTRKKEYFIGDVKPASGRVPNEQIQIADPLTGEVLAAFEEHEDGWVDTTEKEAEPPPAVTGLSLAALRSKGQELISERRGIEAEINTQREKVEDPATRQKVNPADWDALLTKHAAKFTALADELAGAHSDKPSAQGLIDEYRAQARDLTRLGQQLCSKAYKLQWPTQESVTYLWEHGEIDINLTSAADPDRPTLSGDFFVEYAVYDKRTKPPQVLWYAHFHYPTAKTPPAGYSRAHLKLRDQRKFTQKDLLKKHVQEYLNNLKEPGSSPVTKIIYMLIEAPLDAVFLKIAPTPSKRS
ncbi:dermonecrotic toxin domain-containing protein [Pseudomonas sp. R5-89-07]|uniref:dermonecrotic toxin domain-containing protein n=1 Tax=Pseudomonas sp. R5-89-07 TaxID=658644 RepID=UPI000F569492|nr:DUF6543 domain-containing protein [Pseudomonas sp. R5-89-07]AZF05157.1 hypothetical protein C4J94_2389 [Pseudomonas sp. R5-89-07]